MKTSVVVAFLLLALGSFAHGQTLEWLRQVGTSSDDISWGVSADGLGNVYITGNEPFAGSSGAFLTKYDGHGAPQWTRQLDTGEFDRSWDVSADGLGNVYISGFTEGSLVDGQINAGSNDAFLSKYDEEGALQWTRQFGTGGSDEGRGVSADGLGNVYITGFTEGSLVDGQINAGSSDAFLSKYDEHGTLRWTRQLGTSTKDESVSVSADLLGSVYISGFSGRLGGNAGGSDAFVSKYDADGTLQWTRSLGTRGPDWSNRVSSDGLGNVYISGSTSGSLGEEPFAGGDFDAFVSKFDAAGTLQWTRQLGTSGDEWSNGVSADRLGGVYISGFTEGNLGAHNAGAWDAFVSKYNASGTLQWTQQLGTTVHESSLGVSADRLGNVYISGYTEGDLEGPNAGDWDAFVAKFTEVRKAGDFDRDGDLDGDDVDLLGKEIIAGTNNSDFDLVHDGIVDQFDSNFWVHDLKDTFFGDANLDGEFNSADLVSVFQAGHYEDGIAMNSGWAEGDWNGNGDFESGDLVIAFQDGGYEQGPRAAANAVPEPTAVMLMVTGLFYVWRRHTLYDHTLAQLRVLTS